LFSGCAASNENQVDTPHGSNQPDSDAGRSTSYKAQAKKQRSGGMIAHNNSNLTVSQDVSERIANMPGVDTATVLMTDHNAYVAVMLKSEAREDGNLTG